MSNCLSHMDMLGDGGGRVGAGTAIDPLFIKWLFYYIMVTDVQNDFWRAKKNEKKCEYVMIIVRLAGWVYICGRNVNIAIFSDTEYNQRQFLHDGSTHQALPIHTIFSDLDCITRLQQCQTVSTENFMFLLSYVETLCNCWLLQVDHEYTTIFHFRTCSREINDIYVLVCKIFNIGFI